MKNSYLYYSGHYPTNAPHTQKILQAAEKLENKLRSIDPSNLPISEYNQRYLGGHVTSQDALLLNLKKYTFILSWALAGTNKELEKLTFMDYGGGHGMLSFLAKQSGIGVVIHNDIYPVSCQDAETVSKHLSVPLDHYIPGDINDVISYFEDNSIYCDVIANYDVIEHIYDINEFLLKLSEIPTAGLSIFLASAANERNPIIGNALRRQHIAFETRDREYRKGRKPTDTNKALLELRRDIVRDYAPQLKDEEVNCLAKLTRGLIKNDIEESVQVYLDTSVLPQPPDHPTNTCDPFTGNWFEHLMDPYKLSRTLDVYGFVSTVRCGYYDSPRNTIKRSIKHVLNFIIRQTGPFGLYFAPYYAIHAIKK